MKKKVTARPTVKVWITKYALSKGIICANAERCLGGGDMIVAKSMGVHAYFHKEGKDWHLSEGPAQERAREMAFKKLVSLKKQRTKVEELIEDGFEVIEQ